jgi:hypothetical protein
MARRKLGLVPMDAMTIGRLQSFLLVLLVIWAAVPLALAAPKGLKRAAAAASADDVLPIMAVGTGCAALVMCPGSEAARVLKRVRTIVMQLPVAADGTMPMALTTAAQYYLGMCQSYDATDRRTSNPGGKATGVSNFSAGAKAMWIYAVEWQEQNHSPNPVSAALCNHSTPILPTRYFRGKEVVNIEYHQMMSNISRWCDPDHRDVILSNAADSKRKCLLNSASGRDPSFPKMEKVLAAEIIKAREAKHRVALDWLSVRAVALLKQQPELQAVGWQEFKASRHWRSAFMHRRGFSVRKKTNSKTKSVMERVPLLLAWTRRYRHRLQTGEQHGGVYGAFDLLHRFNVDQVPLPFVIGADHTVEVKGADFVQIKSPGDYLAKRQATLQVMFRADGTQPCLAIIFRGKGTTYIGEEKRLLENIVDPETGEHLPIDVYYNEKAWADPQFTIAWLKRSMKAAVSELCGDGKPVLLLADNLSGQDVRASAGDIGRRARDTASSIGVEWWNLVSGCTDTLQPVDAGLGRELKRMIGKISGEWLADETNLLRWEGGRVSNPPQPSDVKPLAATDRRVLMATWAAIAWKRICARQTMLQRYFERTGCALQAQPGESDLLVKLEQLTPSEVNQYVQDLATPYDKADDVMDTQSYLKMLTIKDLKAMCKHAKIVIKGQVVTPATSTQKEKRKGIVKADYVKGLMGIEYEEDLIDSTKTSRDTSSNVDIVVGDSDGIDDIDDASTTAITSVSQLHSDATSAATNIATGERVYYVGDCDALSHLYTAAGCGGAR